MRRPFKVEVLPGLHSLAVFSLWAYTNHCQPAGQPRALGSVATVDAPVLIQRALQAMLAEAVAPD